MIKSNRLSFRPLELNDAKLLFPLHSNKEVMKFIRSPDKSLQNTQKTVEQNLTYAKRYPGYGLFLSFMGDQFVGWLVIVHIESNEKNPIEIGYRLLPKYWGIGLATEICIAGCLYAKEELKLSKISAITKPDHVKSHNVLLKSGFQNIGIKYYHSQDVLFFEKIL